MPVPEDYAPAISLLRELARAAEPDSPLPDALRIVEAALDDPFELEPTLIALTLDAYSDR